MARTRHGRGAAADEAPVNRGGLKTFRTLPSFRLHVLARLSERFHEQYYQRAFGLSLLECRMIGITGDFGQLSFKRLCAAANLDKSHASRLINRLIRRRLLRKLSHPSDQRSVMLGLTASGINSHRALHATATMLAERWLGVLRPQARRVVQASLATLIEQIREMSDAEAAAAGRRSKRPVLPKHNAESEAALREVVVDRRMARQLYELLGNALGEKIVTPRSRRPAR